MIVYDYDFNYDGIYGGYYDDNYSISATNNNNNILRIHNNNYYDNDIIYHDILPSDTQTNVESMVVRSIYHFHRVCNDNYEAESYNDTYYVRSNDSNSHTYDGNKN